MNAAVDFHPELSVHSGDLPRHNSKLLSYDKLMYRVLLAHLPVLAFLAPWGVGTFTLGISSAIAIGLIASFAYAQFKGTMAFGMISGALLMAISAALIQVQLGRLEMHFHIFGGLALLLLYRDWRPVVAGAGFIAVHHLVFTALQLYQIPVLGSEITLYGYGCSWGIFLLHATFVVFESAALIYFAHLMRQEQAYTDQLVDAVSQVNRDHNLSVRIPESATNDSGRAFNRLLSDVEQLISELAGASGQLGTVSEQLKSSSDDATQSSQNQHRAVSDASDAMVELTATIEAVSQNAQQTAEVTAEADIQVRTGEERVAGAIKKTHTLVSGMEEANKSIETLSERVSSIGAVVDVIRDISEQTNLLALNAAIEAARAGEHGRGFAVVSDEVRELAQRTRSSTEEIQDIIESLQKTTNTAVSHINLGREASERTAEAMNSADESFKGISEIVQRINEMSASNASSTEQQSASIKGITENIGRVSEFSVGSVDNAQKTQSAAAELAELAGNLESKIRRYTR